MKIVSRTISTKHSNRMDIRLDDNDVDTYARHEIERWLLSTALPRAPMWDVARRKIETMIMFDELQTISRMINGAMRWLSAALLGVIKRCAEH
eukprot:5719258-Pleurochrysis_carterae.AAC.7